MDKTVHIATLLAQHLLILQKADILFAIKIISRKQTPVQSCIVDVSKVSKLFSTE